MTRLTDRGQARLATADPTATSPWHAPTKRIVADRARMSCEFEVEKPKTSLMSEWGERRPAISLGWKMGRS